LPTVGAGGCAGAVDRADADSDGWADAGVFVVVGAGRAAGDPDGAW
jgi:hypothetical protein